MPNLNISFTPVSPAPANGYRVKYWNVNTPATIITVTPNPTSSPVSISGVAAGCYAGTIESACSGSQFSSPVSFNACSAGQAYCVEVTSNTFTEASTECSGVNDSYTVYTFTLKNSNGDTVNAPSNVSITFDGWTNYPGGAGAFNGSATINSGSSSATSTVYTSQALNGAPGCPCPCETTVSIDEESFAASIASPNTVTICEEAPPPPPTYYYYTGIRCGGSEQVAFRSTVSNLADQGKIVKALCAVCGNTEQCFDNLTPTATPNTNDVIAVYDDCSTCTGGGGGSEAGWCYYNNNIAQTVGPFATYTECQNAANAAGGFICNQCIA